MRAIEELKYLALCDSCNKIRGSPTYDQRTLTSQQKDGRTDGRHTLA